MDQVAEMISQIAAEEEKRITEKATGNPTSPHCELVLGERPKCYDFREVRSWVLCKAWDILEEEKLPRLPVGEAWAEVRKVCRA